VPLLAFRQPGLLLPRRLLRLDVAAFAVAGISPYRSTKHFGPEIAPRLIADWTEIPALLRD
jgi:hypothetical protein